MSTRKELFAMTIPLPQYCKQQYNCERLRAEPTMQDGHELTAYRCRGNTDNCPWVESQCRKPTVALVDIGGVTYFEEDDRYLCRHCGSKGHPTRICPEPL